MFRAVPVNWVDVVAALAREFHFAPSEIWKMDLDDLAFWAGRLTR